LKADQNANQKLTKFLQKMKEQSKK